MSFSSSSNPSEEEDRVMSRQLYRPGSTPAPSKAVTSSPARTPAKTPAAPAVKRPSAKANEKPSGGKRILLMLLLLGVGYYLIYGTPAQRKRTMVGLGVAAWMLFLGVTSYCIFVPNMEDMARERRAIWSDTSLTPEQKFEKFREFDKKLTKEERQQVREIDMKDRERKGNAEIHKFLTMSTEDQVAYLKQKDEDRKKFVEQMRATWANRPRGGGTGGGGGGGQGGGGGRGGAGGGGQAAAGGGGGGGGGGMARGGGGPGGGGRGGPGGFGGGGPGGGRDSGLRGKTRLDNSSPESRAGRNFQRGMARQLGLGGGGFGGPRRP